MDIMRFYAFLPAAARPAFFSVYGKLDESVRGIARLRATFHAISLAWFGMELGDEDLQYESRCALQFVLE